MNKDLTGTESTAQMLLSVEVVEFLHVTQVLSVFGRNRLVMTRDQAAGTVAVQKAACLQTPANQSVKI